MPILIVIIIIIISIVITIYPLQYSHHIIGTQPEEAPNETRAPDLLAHGPAEAALSRFGRPRAGREV